MVRLSSAASTALCLLAAGGTAVAAQGLSGGPKDSGSGGKKKPAPRETLSQFAECLKTSSKADCAESLSEYLPEDANAAKGAMETMLREGAKTAVGDEMDNCIDSGKTKAECRDVIKESMKQMLGDDVDTDDVKKALLDAGKQKAGDAVKSCVEGASTSEAKKACQVGDNAKAAFAKASGKDLADITEEDLKKAARDGAIGGLRDLVKACVANGTAVADCDKPEDLKKMLKEFGYDDMPDAKVREFLDQGAQREALDGMKGCKGLSGADLETCLNAAKESFAQAAGKRAEDVKKFDMTKGAKDALERDLGERMDFCVEEAADNETAVKECVKKMASHIKEARADGRQPSDAEVAKKLRGAAERAIMDVRESCSGAADCDEKIKEEVAKCLGKKKEEVRKMEMKKMEGEGAKKAVADRAMACVDAKKDNATAVCEDMLETYMEMKGRPVPSDTQKKAVAKKKTGKLVATAIMKDAASVCLEEASATDFQACMQQAGDSLGAVVDELLDHGANSTKGMKGKQAAEKKGMKLAVGELFALCVLEAGGQNATETEKTACKSELQSNLLLAGIGEDSDAIADKFVSSVFSDPLEACDDGSDAELKSCRAEAKEMALEYGMKKREYVMMKKIGTIAPVAETLASCLEVEGATAAACEAEAKEAFVKASGFEEAAYEDVRVHVERVADIIMEGNSTEFRKMLQLHLAFHDSEKNCTDEKVQFIIGKINETKPENLGAVILESCRIVDDVAEHAFVIEAEDLTAGAFDTTADTLESDFSVASTRLRRRLLSTTLDAYVAQNTHECAEGDQNCGGLVVSDESTEGPAVAASDASPKRAASKLSLALGCFVAGAGLLLA